MSLILAQTLGTLGVGKSADLLVLGARYGRLRLLAAGATLAAVR